MTAPQASLPHSADSAPQRRLRARQWLGLFIVAAGLLIGVASMLLDAASG